MSGVKFSGRTVCVIAGGMSVTARAVRHIALSRMNDKCRVIAVNDAVYLAWWADWLHAGDYKWWAANIDRVQHFRGLKTTIDGVPSGWASNLTNTGRDGFDPDTGTCRNGNNSGYQAVHCAIQAGAAKIVLVGFDMCGRHWFGAHPTEPTPDYGKAMVPHFESLLPALAERRIDVANCALGSMLKCFRIGSLEHELPI